MFRTSAVTVNEWSNEFKYYKLTETVETLDDISEDIIDLSLRERIKIQDARKILEKYRDNLPPWD